MVDGRRAARVHLLTVVLVVLTVAAATGVVGPLNRP
jgi:hypothetical protein